ncbi:hypothetical protein H1R20_g10283, partial [Candolleomyces eurysporus]|uniref:Uncharacterized protein n=2 Tax=Candolleomyces TaxID=2791032 RepID=A0A4Q2DG79_9AGAR
MGILSNVLGFATFGLAARFGQLGIQKRNLFSNPGGHIIAMGAFGFAGYWAHKWDIRAAEIIAEKKSLLEERRRKQITQAEALGSQQLAEAE